MTELHLIGIGTGNPDHITVQGQRAIAHSDLILIPQKGDGKADLADLRTQIVETIRPGAPLAYFDMPVRDESLPYLDRVEAWHHEIAQRWAAVLSANPQAKSAALLVWGDPSLYDSTLRIASYLTPAPQIRVIPGITSLQALTAAHAIPLNTVNGPITITTGRRLREEGWPQSTETAVVMLDGECSFRELDMAQYDIWWGAYLGMDEQMIEAGPLREVAKTIVTRREAARVAHGWIMDTYLLRRR